MSRTTKVNWRVPTQEWEATQNYITEKHEAEYFYFRLVIQQAMKEMIDADSGLETENLVDKHIEACPLSRSGFLQPNYSIPDDDDTTRIRTPINVDLRDKFQRFAKENTDYREGMALAHALYRYRTGGRRQRINDKLHALTSSSADEVGDYDPDKMDIQYNNVALDKLDQRTRQYTKYKICKQFDPDPGREFHENDIKEKIKSIAGLLSADAYFDEVVDTLNLVEHPCAPSVYVHEDRAVEIREANLETVLGQDEEIDVDDALLSIDCRDGFDDLDTEERRTKIKIELARTAVKKNRRLFKVDYNFIHDRVFDRKTSSGYANNVMDVVAEADGYHLDTSNGKRLTVNLEHIDIKIRKLLEAEQNVDTSHQQQDHPHSHHHADDNEQDQDTEEEQDEFEADVADKMNELMNAQSVTDGG